jgi:hypothetical protein
MITNHQLCYSLKLIQVNLHVRANLGRVHQPIANVTKMLEQQTDEAAVLIAEQKGDPPDQSVILTNAISDVF